MVLAENGEDTLAVCTECSYAANVEKASVPAVVKKDENADLEDLVKVETPGMKKVDRVADFLKVTPVNLIKSMVYQADGEPVMALVRGDREVQTVKLKNLLSATEVELLPDDAVWAQTKLPVGYMGPVAVDIKVVADHEVMAMANAVCGANEKGYHLRGVNPERDFGADLIGDLRQITEKDGCPLCGSAIRLTEGIEVGHIFKLGTGYSESMKATFQDQNGQEQFFVMGCYGIGVSRVVAAAIEQNHDKDGIIWPLPLAPFQVVVLNLGLKDEEICDAAEKLYRDLQAQGISVLHDDRDERPGSKFKDADLIGFPYRVTVGKTFKKQGKVELRRRSDGETSEVALTEAAAVISEMIGQDLARFAG
jgi:prolyl-tRNA synthetase